MKPANHLRMIRTRSRCGFSKVIDQSGESVAFAFWIETKLAMSDQQENHPGSLFITRWRLTSTWSWFFSLSSLIMTHFCVWKDNLNWSVVVIIWHRYLTYDWHLKAEGEKQFDARLNYSLSKQVVSAFHLFHWMEKEDCRSYRIFFLSSCFVCNAYFFIMITIEDKE